jgi:hypothetical protein
MQVTTVPEPISTAAIAVALIGFAAFRMRSK